MMIYTTMIATRWIALRAAEDGWEFPSADRAREPDRAIMRLGAVRSLSDKALAWEGPQCVCP
jgi:hypothetical protein